MKNVILIILFFLAVDFLPAQLKVKPLDPAFTDFPDASLQDFSFLLDAPAGKNGFIKTGEDGHFYFSKNNKRIRFFGVTIAAANIDVPHKRIDEVLDVLARGGCNILRLHEIDNRGGEKFNLIRRNLIDESTPNENNSQHFDKEYLDRLDYWIAGAKQRGIYIYLVVRGYRTFKPGDGIPETDKFERKGSPYSLFSKKIINLQMKYLEEFLFDHTNPYTKLSYGLDPGIAMIELINEDSFFFHPDIWSNLIEPYKSELKNYWNEFIIKKYINNENFLRVYKDVLLSDERFGSVELPDKRNGMDLRLQSEVRMQDGNEFLGSLQMNFFNMMKNFIRKKGSPIPLTVTVNSLNKYDTYTVANTLDFIGQNAYQDHPNFSEGEEWVGKPSYSNKNYLKESDGYCLQSFCAQYAWKNKPIVIREWATCWPNNYRVSSMLQITANSLLQDYDGLIFFSYYTKGDINTISSFGLQSDPTLWGIFPYAAKMFINGEIQPNQNSFEFVQKVNQFMNKGERLEPLSKIAFIGKFRLCVDRGSENSVIISDATGIDYPMVHKNSIIRVSALDKIPDNIKRTLGIKIGQFDEETITKSGFQPVYVNKSLCGFYLSINQIVILATDKPDDIIEISKRMQIRRQKNLLKLPENSLEYQNTKEVSFDTYNGRLIIKTPFTESISGEMNISENYRINKIYYSPSSNISAFIATSFDGNELAKSNKISIKIATIAKNRNENLSPLKTGRFVLTDKGAFPVQTGGKNIDKPASIYIEEKKFIDLFQENGTFEILFEKVKKNLYFYSDSRNIDVELGNTFGNNNKFKIERYFQEIGSEKPKESGSRFTYPAYSKYLRISW